MPIEKLRNASTPAPGYDFRLISIPTVLGNLVTVFTAGNRRTTDAVSLGDSVTSHRKGVRDVLLAGLQNPKHWSALGEDDLDSTLDTRSVMEHLMEVVNRLFWATALPPSRIRDYGQDLAKRLMSNNDDEFGSWRRIAVAAPGLGFARSYYHPEFLSFLDTFDPLAMPSEAHPASIDFAALCFEMDRANLSPFAIPQLKTIGGVDSKDPIAGKIRATTEQVQWLGAIPTNYLKQLPCLWAHIHAPFYRLCAALDQRRFPHLKSRHDEWFIDLDRVLAEPLHPLTATVLSAYRTGQCDTQHGELPMYSLATTVIGDDIGRTFTAAVLKQLAQLVDSSWGDFATPSSDNAVSTIPAFSARLGSLVGIAEYSNDVARALGWGGRGSDLSATVDATVTPSFVLCDGQKYSADCGQVIAGVTPSLSLGLVRGVGLENEMYDGAFSVDKYDWSVAVVDGYAAPSSPAAVYARHTVVGGMWMGESDAERVPAMNLQQDELGRMVIEWYSMEARGLSFVSDLYERPDSSKIKGLPPGLPWDVFAETSDPETAQTTMLTAYPTASVRPIAECALYTYVGSAASGRFYHRVPVRNSLLRTSKLTDTGHLYVDNDGRVRYRFPRAHRVLFRERTVDVSFDSGKAEKIVDLLAVANQAAAPVQPDPDQAVPA